MLTDKSIPYILIQRTDLLNSNRILRFFSTIISYFTKKSRLEIQASLDAILHKNKILINYNSIISDEYRDLKEFLPKECENVLDIGCGVALIDIYIYKHFETKPIITLLDKTAIDNNIHFGFKKTGSFYNSLVVARNNLKFNNIPESKIKCIEIQENQVVKIGSNYDLVISFLAWGFHFPVEFYIKEVFQAMNTKAVLILDIRNNTDGIDTLKNYFEEITIISKNDKYKRVRCIKK